MGSWIQASEGRQDRDKPQACGEHESGQIDDPVRNRLGNSPTEIRLARKMVLFDIFGALAPWIGEGVKERTEINSKN